jgi:hypothetical protein
LSSFGIFRHNYSKPDIDLIGMKTIMVKGFLRDLNNR